MSSDAQTLRLYNTLSRKKEAFTPLDPANVRMYVCGPTVYDFAHIGNARPVIVFDVLYRLLRHLYGEKHVTYVRNITDVDDKINARALRDHPDLPLNDAIRRVTETTATQFKNDATALGCLEPSFEPRATEHIPGMVAMIENLIEKQHAYVAGGEVLFRVDSMDEYGQLSGRNLEDNIAGARVAVESHKENPADFVLWKLSSENEPGWDSPWGRGRPGWHIECSAMSEALLGKVFDIHGGGLDLIFPHHENEIAQSRCAHGTAMMANYWMHNGYLQVEGRKMSKSEGNFITIHDLLETEKFGGRKWPGEVLRLAMLMTHYREPIDFSVARLEEASNILAGLWSRPEHMGGDDASIAPSVAAVLCDDLNTPRAVAEIQKMYAIGNFDELAATLRALGFSRNPFSISDAENERIAERANSRLDALNAKDFSKADAIRAELLAEGIQLMDFKDPETGERRTKWEVKR
jgi:cysteinyl-tRNA synthetase